MRCEAAIVQGRDREIPHVKGEMRGTAARGIQHGNRYPKAMIYHFMGEEFAGRRLE
jgi:hypothetical protein